MTQFFWTTALHYFLIHFLKSRVIVNRIARHVCTITTFQWDCSNRYCMAVSPMMLVAGNRPKLTSIGSIHSLPHSNPTVAIDITRSTVLFVYLIDICSLIEFVLEQMPCIIECHCLIENSWLCNITCVCCTDHPITQTWQFIIRIQFNNSIVICALALILCCCIHDEWLNHKMK